MSEPVIDPKLDDLAVNAIKFLSVDAIEKARSGHPGMPMGAADYSYTLWAKHLRYNPKDTAWPNRDRFVLSAGHGSMLLYSLLHLAGFDISLDDIKEFRQWNSKTPGHPEREPQHGIETTTGPLGQGISNAVGMAMAQTRLAALFNKPGYDVVDNHIFVIASDGDLQEGISHESCGLAGHLGLGSLIVIYDDNHISIEGNTDLAYSDNVAMRFEAYGWHVQSIDGHDRGAADKALSIAKEVKDKPSIIIARTHIANGAPTKQDTASSHGEPLGEKEILGAKELAGWPSQPDFYVPQEVYDLFAKRAEQLLSDYKAWQDMFAKYRQHYPEQADLWDKMMSKCVPENIEDAIMPSIDLEKPVATRAASGAVMQEIAKLVPSLWGGSADLAPSTKTDIKNAGSFGKNNRLGWNLHFGIREHGMMSAVNGIGLYGGFIPYGSTFLIFSDYARPAIRLAGLMNLQAIHVYTHDSFFVGEDGPTHEPIEHLASLRAIPNVKVIRPADAAETIVAWAVALENRTGPSILALTRQNLPPCNDDPAKAKGLRKGGYVVRDADRIDAVIIATGSEVSAAIGAADLLAAKGIKVRVVSMPCTELFDEQDAAYRDSIIPPDVKKRLVVEAAVPLGWCKYAGDDGLIIGMNRFGASAPANVLAEKFGFTPEAIAAKVEKYLG
ncbi:MAG: transketolase [Armatimonadetes bacterium]|jgi:transketolase|nr:transketolase [Armatimonadota bacterium]